jgi:hypothetical protein
MIYYRDNRPAIAQTSLPSLLTQRPVAAGETSPSQDLNRDDQPRHNERALILQRQQPSTRGQTQSRAWRG